MLKYFSEIDMFGTPFYFNTPTGKTHYQTVVGGLTTITVLTLSFLYFLYVMIQWNLGLLLPRASSSLVTSTYQEFHIQGQMLRIGILDQSGLEINPFASTNNIITPLVIYMSDFTKSQPQPIFSEESSDGSGQQIVIRDVELVQSATKRDNQKVNKFMFLSFAPCDPVYLKLGQSCAPQSQIDDYIQHFAQAMRLSIQVQQFDTVTNTFSSIVKQSYMIFDSSLRLYSQLTLQYTLQEHDDGILMQNQKFSHFISDYELFTQVVTKQYSKNYFGFDSLATFLIKLNDLRVEQRIVQIKITEILAQVGSVVSILLGIRALIELVNHSLLRQEVIDSTLKFQYPKFRGLQIQRNCFGSIVEVKKSEQQLDLDLFKRYYSLAEKRMLQNFTITNILRGVILSQPKKHQSLEIEDIRDAQKKVMPEPLNNQSQEEIENIFNTNLGGDE